MLSWTKQCKLQQYLYIIYSILQILFIIASFLNPSFLFVCMQALVLAFLSFSTQCFVLCFITLSSFFSFQLVSTYYLLQLHLLGLFHLPFQLFFFYICMYACNHTFIHSSLSQFVFINLFPLFILWSLLDPNSRFLIVIGKMYDVLLVNMYGPGWYNVEFFMHLFSTFLICHHTPSSYVVT